MECPIPRSRAVTVGTDVTNHPNKPGLRRLLRWHAVGLTTPILTEGDRMWSRWLRNRDDSAPRSLEQLLKQVEKGTQVRSSGLDGVLAELKQHRDSTPDGDLRSAL